MPVKQPFLKRLVRSWQQLIGMAPGNSYAVLDPRRKVIQQIYDTHQTQKSTANAILSASLPRLRAYSRKLCRDNPTAVAVTEALCALIVGTGIDLVPDTGDTRLDDLIRAEWQRYIAHCDIAGRNLYIVQREACREMVTAGEALWRFVVDDSITDPRAIKLRVLPLESEWIDDEAAFPDDETAISRVAGIALDKFGRPVRYALANPESDGKPEFVSASDVAHIFEKKRALQARGEPWMTQIIERLINEGDLVDAELLAARQSAALAIVITSPAGSPLDQPEEDDGADPTRGIRLGGIASLYPGEDVKAFSHNRPSQAIAPFRSMLRGDIAAAMRIPQRYLDRDPSKANYSSLRGDQQDSERLLAPIREYFGDQTAGRLYKAVLPLICLKLGIKTPSMNYRLLPDVQAYVDPQKDIAASLDAIRGGLSTYEIEISKRGGNYLDVWQQRAKELAEASSMGVPLSDEQTQQQTDTAEEQSE